MQLIVRFRPELVVTYSDGLFCGYSGEPDDEGTSRLLMKRMKFA